MCDNNLDEESSVSVPDHDCSGNEECVICTLYSKYSTAGLISDDFYTRVSKIDAAQTSGKTRKNHIKSRQILHLNNFINGSHDTLQYYWVIIITHSFQQNIMSIFDIFSLRLVCKSFSSDTGLRQFLLNSFREYIVAFNGIRYPEICKNKIAKYMSVIRPTVSLFTYGNDRVEILPVLEYDPETGYNYVKTTGEFAHLYITPDLNIIESMLKDEKLGELIKKTNNRPDIKLMIAQKLLISKSIIDDNAYESYHIDRAHSEKPSLKDQIDDLTVLLKYKECRTLGDAFKIFRKLHGGPILLELVEERGDNKFLNGEDLFEYLIGQDSEYTMILINSLYEKQFIDKGISKSEIMFSLAKWANLSGFTKDNAIVNIKKFLPIILLESAEFCGLQVECICQENLLKLHALDNSSQHSVFFISGNYPGVSIFYVNPRSMEVNLGRFVAKEENTLYDERGTIISFTLKDYSGEKKYDDMWEIISSNNSIWVSFEKMKLMSEDDFFKKMSLTF